jgi:hypothetical protein
MNMEKRLSLVAFWIGVVCTVLAVITRGLLMIGVLVFPLVASSPTHVQLSPKSFLDGAILFYVMAIASSATAWAKTQRTK